MKSVFTPSGTISDAVTGAESATGD